MKIKSITIEGMQKIVSKTIEFSDLQYLYGPNGAGKSTILKAIQLALLGYIPGEPKKASAIAKHARGNMLSISCTVVDDAGHDIKINKTWSMKGGSGTSTVDVSPEVDIDAFLKDVELPVYNFNEFLQLSPNMMKKWFMDYLPDDADDFKWEKHLRNCVKDMQLSGTTIDDLIKEAKEAAKGHGVEFMKSLNAHMKDKVSFLKGNIESLNGTVQSLVHYDDCETSLSSETISQQLAEMNIKLAAAQNAERIRKNNADIYERLKPYESMSADVEHDEEYNQLTAQYTKLSETHSAKCSRRTELAVNIKNNERRMREEENKKSSKGICPITQKSCESAEAIAEEADKQLKALREEYNSYKAGTDKVSKEIYELEKQMRDIEMSKKSIVCKYRERDRLQAMLQPEPLVDGEEASCQELEKKIKELTDLSMKVAANEKYSQLMDTVTADKFAKELELAIYKKWVTETGENGMQNAMMAKPFENLNDTMTTYIQKMFNDDSITSKFILSEKSNSFSFGIERDGKYLPYDLLSSGEQCIYALALMCCLISYSPSPLKVLMVDDLLDHLDEENAERLFNALYNIKDIQIILAGVKPCCNSFKDEIVVNVN